MSDTKPFNAEHAKAGAPYGCRNGEEATVLKWDSRQTQFPLHGVRSYADLPTSWTLAGTYHGDGEMDRLDLVMLPLGHIDGKPVFMGDIVIGEAGKLSEVCNPGFSRWDRCRWPVPEKQCPTFTGDLDRLRAAYNSVLGSTVNGALECVANAALRHAIDAGLVVAKEDHEAALVRLGEQLRDITIGRNPTRDMAIAEAVQQAAFEAVRSAGADLQYMALNSMNLPAIIATVKP